MATEKFLQRCSDALAVLKHDMLKQKRRADRAVMPGQWGGVAHHRRKIVRRLRHPAGQIDFDVAEPGRFGGVAHPPLGIAYFLLR